MPSALAPLNDFLCEVYHIDPVLAARDAGQYPSLPTLMTLVDTAIARREDVTRSWTWTRLSEVRRAIEHAIFLSLKVRLKEVPRNYYHELFMNACTDDDGPIAISLNYDTLVDRAMIELSAWVGAMNFPAYGCSLRVPSGDRRFGQLLKLHGSISWLRCPKCPGLRFVIPDLSIYRDRVPDAFVDPRSLDKPEIPCRECGSPVGSCIVAPTQRKTYDIPALNEVWSEAERVLKRAGRVYFIGYSLPEDDVEIALLLRRSLDGVDPARITVVEWDEQRRERDDHPVGKRYASLFGKVGWFSGGFAAWPDHQGKSDGWRAQR